MSDYQPQFDPQDEVSQLSLLVLKKTREQQALSIKEVSERIKISVAHIEALESSEYDRLPGLAFARGYLRTYGRFLGLDDDALIRDFNAHYGVDAQQVRTINRVKPQTQLGDPIIRISLVVFVLVIIGSSIWWWQTQMGRGAMILGDQPLAEVSALRDSGQDDTGDGSDPETVIVTGSASSEQGSEVDADSASTLDQSAETADAIEPEPQNLSEQDIARLTRDLEQASTAGSDGTDAITSSQSPVQVEAVAEVVTEQEQAVVPRLLIRFGRECWVSIKNADGKTIFASLLDAGDTLERDLSSLPVELLIGSSGAVIEAEFRGQPLDVTKFSKKGVARLTLE